MTYRPCRWAEKLDGRVELTGDTCRPSGKLLIKKINVHWYLQHWEFGGADLPMQSSSPKVLSALSPPLHHGVQSPLLWRDCCCPSLFWLNDNLLLQRRYSFVYFYAFSINTNLTLRIFTKQKPRGYGIWEVFHEDRRIICVQVPEL